MATLQARARPRLIRITERFVYDGAISSLPQVRLPGPPTGLLEVLIPYDGTTFSGDACQQMAKAQKLAHASGVQRELLAAGYLGVGRNAPAELVEHLQLNLTNHIMPLEIPVYQKGRLETKEDLCSGLYTCRLAFPYQLPRPESPLFHMQVAVSDEDTLRRAQTRLLQLEDGDARRRQLERIGQQVALPARFEAGVRLTFTLDLALPGSLLPQADEPPPSAAMTLEWPVPTSHRRLRLFVDGKPHPLRYDARRRQVTWAEIPFHDSGDEKATDDLLRLHTRPVTLEVDDPTPLFQQEQLTGSAEITIPRLYSGMTTRFFDVLGHERPVPTEHKTVITARLYLDLPDSFRYRRYSPYQQLQFPGIILERMRLADIRAALSSIGFNRFQPWQELDAPAGMARYLLTSSRPEGSGEFLLWVVAEGEMVDTWREREIDGGETFVTPRDSGDLTLYFRGELLGDSARPVQLMGDIHALLKERFEHVRTLK